MTEGRAATIHPDGIFRPEPWFSDDRWIAVAFKRNGRKITRMIHGVTFRGRHMPSVYPSEIEAQAMCDELNK